MHYLQNAYRGPVWEEVIIHAPPEVDLVCLSATVSNAEEFADWLRTVRGATTAVIEDRRPVELHDLYLIGDRQSEPDAPAAHPGGRPPQPRGGRRGRQGIPPAGAPGHQPGPSVHPPAHRGGRVAGRQRPASRPSTSSSAGRPATTPVSQCVREGGRLTTVEERREIRAIVEERIRSLSSDDLRLLDYDAWLSGLEAGYAAHHAGLVPPFKEAVEACFAAGLVKAVFATETLSLGINMPARSVVIEKLTKFTGERHEFLTPGEYTQLTGRAGRRGIDEVGYGRGAVDPLGQFRPGGGAGRSAQLRPHLKLPPYLQHGGQPGAPLPAGPGPPPAQPVLRPVPCGQRRSVRLETQLERTAAALRDAEAAAVCDRGDTDAYRRLLRASEESARQRPSMTAEVGAALERTRPGDVLVVPGGRSGGRVMVVSTTRRRGGEVRVRALTPQRRVVSLGPRDFRSPPSPVGRVTLPVPYLPRDAGFLRDAALALAEAPLDPTAATGSRRQWRGDVATAQATAAAAHPVAGCPDARSHLRALDRADRLARDAERLAGQVKGRSDSLARQFDRVLRVLEGRGYIEGWAPQ